MTAPQPERMACMEIRGGNRAINRSFEAPGMDLYVHSVPHQASESGGGDIYYLTSCASGRITRILLADVSGHGEAASRLAVSLRDLLRSNVNKISQQLFVEGMNQEFGQLANDSAFATAVVVTFFEPRKSLSISVAGHPFPLYYRAESRKWFSLDPAQLHDGVIGNLPLGIRDESSYPGRTITTERGDMFLLYSDAFIEAEDDQQRQLGISGLVRLLNQSSDLEPAEIIPGVRERVGSLAQENLQDDDATLVLGHFTNTKVRLRDNLLAPVRLLGQVCDQTRLGT